MKEEWEEQEVLACKKMIISSLLLTSFIYILTMLDVEKKAEDLESPSCNKWLLSRLAQLQSPC